MAKGTTRVGQAVAGAGQAEGGDKKSKKEKRVRVLYPNAKQVNKKDKDGNVVKTEDGSPVRIFQFETLPEDYNLRQHLPLGRSDFTSDSGFFGYKALQLRTKGESLIKKADSLTKRAARAKTLGDEKTQKAARKFMKRREELAALEAELKGAGIDLSTLEDDKTENGDE